MIIEFDIEERDVQWLKALLEARKDAFASQISDPIIKKDLERANNWLTEIYRYEAIF